MRGMIHHARPPAAASVVSTVSLTGTIVSFSGSAGPNEIGVTTAGARTGGVGVTTAGYNSIGVTVAGALTAPDAATGGTMAAAAVQLQHFLKET
jgi:hypothetical protein